MAEEKKNGGGVSEYDETILQSEGEIKGEPRAEGGPYLIIVQGPHQGLKFPIAEGDNTIGRIMGSEVILEDQSVSRRHAVVTRSREGLTVEDLGSKNGTLVNTQPLTEKVTIGHGDVIQIGIYSLRVITKEVSKEEEVKPLPAEWEGKTLMIDHKPDEITSTMAEKVKEDGKKGEGVPADTMKDIEGVVEVEEEGPVPEEITEERKRRRKRLSWWNLALIGLLLAIIIGGGAYTYFRFFHKPPRPVEPVKPPPVVEKVPATPGPRPAGDTAAGTPELPLPPPELPSAVPVFLDFASSPLTAEVTFQGKAYGMTPVKVQHKLDVDQEYTAEAAFDLKDIGEVYKEEARFRVERDKPLIPVLFKGPIGVLKVMELPRGVDLYLEGYFVYDPFNAKTAKLGDVVFGKPIYIPYGKYVVELRKEKELAGSGEFFKDIRYRREILVSEDNPVFALKITEEDLNEFPVEVLSIPVNADVFIDANKVGVTPYKGVIPTGEHILSLRKDGYFEHKQDLKMDKNVPVKLEIELKTTESGEFINAGKHLMQKGRYKEAVDKLTEIFKLTPTEGEAAQAKYLIGSCFVHLGDLSSAEGYFKQSVADEGMKHASMLGLVSVYHGLGRRAEAIPLLVEVLLNAKDEVIIREAHALFQQVSPLRSIMYIHTNPEGARVYMNDKPVEETTPMILPDLSLGNYRLRIEKDGYYPQDLSINLSVNEFNPVVVELKKIPE